MPRGGNGRKPRIYRDMCLVMDIVLLVRDGFLLPGHHVGRAELLCISAPEWGPPASIRTLIGAKEGSLHVETPYEQTIPLVRAGEGRGRGDWWRLVCEGRECGRPVRRLYLPGTPPGRETGWACRLCWGIAYRDERIEAASSLREVLRIKADLANLERIMALRVAESRGRGPDT
jgi:hypothetical protein